MEVCGDWDNADRYYQRAVEIRKRMLGPEHPLTAEALQQREVGSPLLVFSLFHRKQVNCGISYFPVL